MDLLKKTVIPPPMRKVITAVDRAPENIPGDIKVDKHGKLLKSYLEMDGLIKPIIEGYNKWVSEILPKQIEAKTIQLDNGIVSFKNIITTLPGYSRANGTTLLYPEEARNKERSYESNVYATVVFTNKNGEEQTANGVHLGRVPVMTGSILCNTHGLTKNQLVEIGECINDPYGYYIIKGTEKIILIQENLRLNRIFTYYNEEKQYVECRMTTTTIKSSHLLCLKEGDKKDIQLNSYHMGKDKNGKDRSLPVFIIFRLAGIQSVEEMLKYVLKFTLKKWEKKIMQVLQPSLFEVSIIPNEIKYILEKKGMENVGKETANETIKTIFDSIFPQIPDDEGYKGKLDMLSLMIIKMAEYMAGLRPLDDRDSWSNKRLESSSRLMQTLFNFILKNFADHIQEKVTKNRITTLDGVIKKCIAIFGDEFINAFTTTNWGVKNSSYQKESITDILKRESLLSTYSHLTKVSSQSSRQTRKMSVRLAQATQLGYICIAETPEGENCGIVKNLAVTCYISLERDEKVVEDLILRTEEVADEKDEQHSTKVILNSKFLGWCNGPVLRRKCVEMRRTKEFPMDICIVLDKYETLHIYCDSSRPTRPLLIVDEDGYLVIEKKNLWDASFNDLLSEGCVEYIDAFEQEGIMLAQSYWDLEKKRKEKQELIDSIEIQKQELIEDFIRGGNVSCETEEEMMEIIEQKIEETGKTPSNPFEENLLSKYTSFKQSNDILVKVASRRPYTHCELDPQSLWGVSASIIPLPEHNQAPRNTYQCSQGKQALGVYATNYTTRFDTTAKTLVYPTRPLFETQFNKILGLNENPAGQMVTVAIGNFLGFNQEDAFIFKKEAIDRELFKMVKYTTFKTIAKMRETIKKPTLKNKEPNNKYSHIQENGLPKIGSRIKEGDCIIGKVRRSQENPEEEENISIFAAYGEGGIVDKIFQGKNSAGNDIVKVKLRDVRNPVVGDKFASRSAQKGTIGIIVPQQDLPFTEEGISPDIIINPLAIPSRMTMGKMIEIVASKVAALTGERINATSFRRFDVDYLTRTLVNYGFNSGGKQTMYSGITGKKLEAQIFIGPCYYQALRHHVKDKIQMRGKGLTQIISREPLAGRSIRGGLRFGEMERDAIISHGATSFLKERLCTSSAAYDAVFCRNCGHLAISSQITNEVYCNLCKEKGNFGVTTIPYPFKLLTNMLAGAGLKLSLKFKEQE